MSEVTRRWTYESRVRGVLQKPSPCNDVSHYEACCVAAEADRDYAALAAANAELTKRLEEAEKRQSTTNAYIIGALVLHLDEMGERRRVDSDDLHTKVCFTLSAYRERLAALTAQLATAEGELERVKGEYSLENGEFARLKTCEAAWLGVANTIGDHPRCQQLLDGQSFANAARQWAAEACRWSEQLSAAQREAAELRELVESLCDKIEAAGWHKSETAEARAALSRLTPSPAKPRHSIAEPARSIIDICDRGEAGRFYLTIREKAMLIEREAKTAATEPTCPVCQRLFHPVQDTSVCAGCLSDFSEQQAKRA